MTGLEKNVYKKLRLLELGNQGHAVCLTHELSLPVNMMSFEIVRAVYSGTLCNNFYKVMGDGWGVPEVCERPSVVLL